MFKTKLPLLIIACFITLIASSQSKERRPLPLLNAADSASYALGVKFGLALHYDSLPGMNKRIFLEALRTKLYNRTLSFDETLADDILKRYFDAIENDSLKVPPQVYKDLSVFETPMAESLKKNIKKTDIEKMQTEELKEAALGMFNKKYDKAYRIASYNAILSPKTLGQQLKIGDGYSKYEGITGIYLPAGRHIVLIDGIEGDKKIGLLVPDWNRRPPDSTKPDKDPAGWGIARQRFALHNGVNIVDVKGNGGLAYIDYYSEDPGKDKPIRVHFVSGKVNGYFDLAKNNDADWNALIDNAIYPVIDAKGKHIQIAYPAAACKKYAYSRGVELIKNYDSLISLQYHLMGLYKYNRIPKNHLLARVNYNYYMFRDGDGVAYMGTNPGNAMPLVVEPESVIKGDPCWGFSHEVGHVHQLRPQFNWGGLGEVSNNVFSLYCTTKFGNESRLSEQKVYQRVRDSIIKRHISYLQDKDPFDRLVPFWQLQLYFSGPANYGDFYPDLFETFRKSGSDEKKDNRESIGRGNNPAIYQLNFIKTACEIGKTDLTGFFDKYGFFYVGSFAIDDYGDYKYNMTQEMVDKCKSEIKAMNLPQPKVDLTTLRD